MKLNEQLTETNSYPMDALMARYRALLNDGVPIINLAVGDPADETCPAARHAAMTFLNDHSSSSYPRHIGSSDYRESVSNWAQEAHGIDLDPNHHVLSCNGTKEAIFSLPLVMDWTANKRMFFSSMAYPVYKKSAQYLNIPFIELPVDRDSNFFPDLSIIHSDQWESCQIFWINSPNNPTTAIASKEYLKSLLNYANTYDFLIASDECYNDLYDDHQPPSMLDFPASDRWIVFRSLSKRSHMTGYRCGAIISKHRDVIRALTQLRSPMGVGTSPIIQAAGQAAWNDRHAIQSTRMDYKMKRSKLRRVLEGAGFKIFGGDAGFYFWISHPDFSSSDAIAEWFLDRNILVTPGHVFGEGGSGYARLVYCVKMNILEQVIERIENKK